MSTEPTLYDWFFIEKGSKNMPGNILLEGRENSVIAFVPPLVHALDLYRSWVYKSGLSPSSIPIGCTQLWSPQSRITVITQWYCVCMHSGTSFCKRPSSNQQDVDLFLGNPHTTVAEESDFLCWYTPLWERLHLSVITQTQGICVLCFSYSQQWATDLSTLSRLSILP